MFRPLARIKQQLPDEECIKLLTTELRGVLSVIGDDDYPYGIPVNHYYDPDTGNIYFHSGRKGHKADAMKAHDKVAFLVCDSGTPEEDSWALNFKSVVVFGRVRLIEDYERGMDIARKLSHKFTSDDSYIENDIRKNGHATNVYEIEVEHMTGKRVNES